jgi:hypothetical protein
VQFERIACQEIIDTTDPMLAAAAKLYEETQHVDERIPWLWIEKGIGNEPQPGGRKKHLIIATADGQLAGFAYGAMIPDYGGYLCYLGVADWARRMGIGTKLYEAFFQLVKLDAAELGTHLPFVVWESHQPGVDATEADWKLWNARVKLFDRVGGLWIEGVDFLSPNFSDVDDAPPISLQLFVKPMDLPAKAFDADRLRELVAGLQEKVYRNGPGDALYDGTLTADCHPRIVPARLAAPIRDETEVLV